MKKALFILVFVLALAITPLIVWDNPAFADFYGDMRRAFGISQGYNASSAVVPNFANGYQIAGSDITTTEAAYFDGLTIGTVTASKAVVVSADKDIGDFRNLDVVNLDAGASAVAGTVDIFPTTASKGKFVFQATDNTTNHNVIVTNGPANSANATVTIPALTGYAALSTAACTLAEVDVLDGAGLTVVASKSVIADADKDIEGIRNLTGTGEAVIPAIQGVDGSASVGGTLSVEGGAGDGAGNAGGPIDVDGGAGVAETAGTGGAGGAITLSSGAGGTATTGTAGASGAVTIESATGGATSGAAGNGGDAGDIAITGGAGGADSEGGSGTGGDGGDITLTPGAGGAGATPGAAGVINLDGTWQISGTTVSSSAADLNELDAISANGGVTFTERVTFTETAASGAYVATVVLPANSVVLAIFENGHVNWGADTSAAMSVGYTGNLTAYANAVDVKAGSAFTGNPKGTGDFFSAGTTITFSCVAVDATSTGGAGRDNYTVHYAIVTSVAATKS